jgi:hypothetical protein
MKTEDFKKNPETAKSFLATAIAALLFVIAPPILGLIALIFSSRFLLKAKKTGEDKKIRKIGNIAIFLPLLIWVVEVIFGALAAMYNIQ